MDSQAIWRARKHQAQTQGTTAGGLVQVRLEALIKKMVSGWPRRGKSVLVMNGGTGGHAGLLWEYGFDVTIQDDCPEYLADARSLLGSRAEYLLGPAEALPVEDCSFDYVVAVGCLEFCQDRQSVLREMSRISCNGAIILFSNVFSVTGLRRKAFFPGWQALSPLSLRADMNKVLPEHRRTWVSLLLPPSLLRRFPLIRNYCHEFFPPCPIGALAGVRINFGRMCTGTPVWVKAKPVDAGQKASNG